jgi:hypothetical protein
MVNIKNTIEYLANILSPLLVNINLTEFELMTQYNLFTCHNEFFSLLLKEIYFTLRGSIDIYPMD